MIKWYRWSVQIVGRESGNITGPLLFVRYRHYSQAQAFCQEMNAVPWDAFAVDTLVYFEPVEI